MSEEFESRKKEEGCVVRTLESITGVQATNEEYSLRFESLYGLRLMEALSTAREFDVWNIISLIEKYRNMESNLGRALKNLEYERVTLSTTDINAKLSQGALIAILGHKHIFHIGTSPGGGFIRLSDRNAPLSLEENWEHDTLIFAPKVLNVLKQVGD